MRWIQNASVLNSALVTVTQGHKMVKPNVDKQAAVSKPQNILFL